MRTRIKKAASFVYLNAEAIIWIVVIAGFALSPVPAGEHLALCPFRLAGLHWCPGCGLGSSLILLLHGQMAASVSTHPLGIPALTIFIFRIVSLLATNGKLQHYPITFIKTNPEKPEYHEQ